MLLADVARRFVSSTTVVTIPLRTISRRSEASRDVGVWLWEIGGGLGLMSVAKGIFECHKKRAG